MLDLDDIIDVPDAPVPSASDDWSGPLENHVESVRSILHSVAPDSVLVAFSLIGGRDVYDDYRLGVDFVAILSAFPPKSITGYDYDDNPTVYPAAVRWAADSFADGGVTRIPPGWFGRLDAGAGETAWHPVDGWSGVVDDIGYDQPVDADGDPFMPSMDCLLKCIHSARDTAGGTNSQESEIHIVL